MNTTGRPLSAGYAASKVRTHSTADGEAFTATLTLNRAVIGTVEQAGRGGPNAYDFTTDEDRLAFNAAAEATFGPGPEVADSLVEHLIDIVEFGRMQSPPYFFEGDSIEFGEHRKAKGRHTYDELHARLAVSPYIERKPHLWDARVESFVPVAA